MHYWIQGWEIVIISSDLKKKIKESTDNKAKLKKKIEENKREEKLCWIYWIYSVWTTYISHYYVNLVVFFSLKNFLIPPVEISGSSPAKNKFVCVWYNHWTCLIEWGVMVCRLFTLLECFCSGFPPEQTAQRPPRSRVNIDDDEDIYGNLPDLAL